MKYDSEGLWKNAENIAYFFNAAINAMKARNEPGKKVNSVLDSIDVIGGHCSKRAFVGVCIEISEQVTFHSGGFKDAIKYALALPEKGEDIYDNMTFPYFATLVKFHIACYKNDWGIEGNK